jgi:hypothetical protein
LRNALRASFVLKEEVLKQEMHILSLDVQHGRAVSSQSAFVWLVEFFVLI